MNKIAKLKTNESSYIKIHEKATIQIEKEILSKLKLRQQEISTDSGKTKEFIIKKKNKKTLKDLAMSLAEYKLIGKIRKQ